MQERTHQAHPKHDPRACNLCAIYRHPGQAAQGRALRAHLQANPFPRPAVNA